MSSVTSRCRFGLITSTMALKMLCTSFMLLMSIANCTVNGTLSDVYNDSGKHLATDDDLPSFPNDSGKHLTTDHAPPDATCEAKRVHEGDDGQVRYHFLEDITKSLPWTIAVDFYPPDGKYERVAECTCVEPTRVSYHTKMGFLFQVLDGHRVVLTILNTSQGHSGAYFCQMMSPATKAAVSCFLNVTERVTAHITEPPSRVTERQNPQSGKRTPSRRPEVTKAETVKAGSGDNTTIIIIVVVVAVVVIASAGCIFLLWKKRRRRTNGDTEAVNEMTHPDSNEEIENGHLTGPATPNHYETGPEESSPLIGSSGTAHASINPSGTDGEGATSPNADSDQEEEETGSLKNPSGSEDTVEDTPTKDPAKILFKKEIECKAAFLRPRLDSLIENQEFPFGDKKGEN